MYYAQLGGEISLVRQVSVPTDAYFFLAVIAQTLLPSKLKSGESMMTYGPQRILRQFRFDQGAY